MTSGRLLFNVSGSIVCTDTGTPYVNNPAFVFSPTMADLAKLRCRYMNSNGIDTGPFASQHAPLSVTSMLRTDESFTTMSTSSRASSGLTGPISTVWANNMHTFAFLIYLPSDVLAAAAGTEFNLLEFGTPLIYKPGGFPAHYLRNASRLVVSASGTFVHTIHTWFREFPIFPTNAWVRVVCASQGNVWYDGVRIPLIRQNGSLPTTDRFRSNGGGVNIGSRPVARAASELSLDRFTVAGIRIKDLMIFEGHQMQSVVWE